MSTVLNNFVTIRKTRGDVLNPTQYATIVAMIRGIVSKYDFASMNRTYKDFLKHLEDHDDPHRDGNSSFFDEFISRVYQYYVLMTPTPVSEVDFRENIVSTFAFLELLRRIILNHELYLSVKVANGSVPGSFSATFGEDWGIRPDRTSTIILGSVTANEAAFFKRGWSSPPGPFNPIFTAVDLTWTPSSESAIFYSSVMIPAFAITDDITDYPISLLTTSNDLSVEFLVSGEIAEPKTIFTLDNGTHALRATYDQNRTVALYLNEAPIATGIACRFGKVKVTISQLGVVALTVLHDGVLTTHNYVADFTNVRPFVSIRQGQPLRTPFGQAFGIEEISVSRAVPIANFQI